MKGSIIQLLLKIQYNPVLLSLPIYAATIWMTWRVRHNFFFYDTIQLASEHASFYYNSNFTQLLLPLGMDSGHPPTFGLYIALCWLLFGKSLIVSHFAMLPFLLGIVYQAWQLGQRLVGDLGAAVFLLALILDPVMAGQAVLVSPDVVLAFFFLWALNTIFKNTPPSVDEHPKSLFPTFKHIALSSLPFLGLSTISMRGMMVVAALFLFQLIWQRPRSWSALRVIIFPYVLGGCMALCFLAYHYIERGWVGYHPDSPWSPAFLRVDFQGFIKNIVLLIWRLLDFGHIILWGITFALSLRYKGYRYFRQTRALWIVLACLIVILSATQLSYRGLLLHRYFLPVYLTLDMVCLKTISDLKGWRHQVYLILLVLAAQWVGNRWVYPQPVATGWDATLAHLPYYKLRNEMLSFIQEQGIPLDSIGSSFPNIRPFSQIDLTENSNTNVRFNAYDLSKNSYIFYSNVMNDFTKEDLQILKKDWQMAHQLRGGYVEVILFQKKND